MTTVRTIQQAPLRNASLSGTGVLTHSGEFFLSVVDCSLRGRGVSLQFDRSYRSALAGEIGGVGRGWTFSYGRRLEQDGSGIRYRDGQGAFHRFEWDGKSRRFVSPPGLYSELVRHKGQMALKGRHGSVMVFENVERGGRLLAVQDRNSNTLRFEHGEDLVEARDPLGQRLSIRLRGNLVHEVSIGNDRHWRFKYDERECLIEVGQPSTREFPQGTRLRYSYDAEGRLATVVDAKGQAVLRNSYDDHGRIAKQLHGHGTLSFEYENTATSGTGNMVRITCKNGAKTELKHDPSGHVVERTQHVATSSLSPEDRGRSRGPYTSLTTKSKFNTMGELIERVFPTGDVSVWKFDESNTDVRARGNLLAFVRTPAKGVQSDQSRIAWTYRYDPEHQFYSAVTNPEGQTTTMKRDRRGNVLERSFSVTVLDLKSGAKRKRRLQERYDWNAAGQLTRGVDARGITTTYEYYAAANPFGTSQANVGDDGLGVGGYLARVRIEPAGRGSREDVAVREYRYDVHGNLAAIVDGRGNARRFEYDGRDLLVRVVSRKPSESQVTIRRDENGRPTSWETSFERYVYDERTSELARRNMSIRQTVSYNALGNVTRRDVVGDDLIATHHFKRDESENVVQETAPSGKVRHFQYDDRNLLREARELGVDGDVTTRYFHTRGGLLRTLVDRLGTSTTCVYDGYHRYGGCVDASGDRKWVRWDALGNATAVGIRGTSRGSRNDKRGVDLASLSITYDELSRPVRVDRSWHGPGGPSSLGASRFGGRGLSSQLMEWSDSHFLTRIAYETGNVLSFEHDGANRITAIGDLSGERVSLDYDHNGNVVSLEHLGPTGPDGQRFRHVVRQAFDGEDRLLSRSANDGPTTHFEYNEQGQLAACVNGAGVRRIMLRDGFGRWAGHAWTEAASEKRSASMPRASSYRLERDASGRVLSRTSASGHTVRYDYDALGRWCGTTLSDGSKLQLRRDPMGNIVSIVDPRRTVVRRRVDAYGRLIERRTEDGEGRTSIRERFQYDSLGRLIRAERGREFIDRVYDSRSKLLREARPGSTIEYSYDAAGNCISLRYPDGSEVRKTYDVLQRVTEVRNEKKELLASYAYFCGNLVRAVRVLDSVEATLTYEPRLHRLEEIVYRSVDGGSVIDGMRYNYDEHGNRTRESRLPLGPIHDYDVDSLGRVRRVVRNSPYQEATFELSPTGRWLTVVRKGIGTSEHRLDSVIDDRDSYRSLGQIQFAVDANGNRIRTSNDGTTRGYEFDHANRLIGVRDMDHGSAVRRVRLGYDMLGRVTTKRVDDKSGTRTVGRVWSGRQLIMESDRLSNRRFIYGAHYGRPLIVVASTKMGHDRLIYTLDGRNGVGTLCSEGGTALQHIRHEAFDMPTRDTNAGAAGGAQLRTAESCPLFGANGVWDEDTGLFQQGDVAFDPSTDQVLNGIGTNGPGLGFHVPGGGAALDIEVGLKVTWGNGKGTVSPTVNGTTPQDVLKGFNDFVGGFNNGKPGSTGIGIDFGPRDSGFGRGLSLGPSSSGSNSGPGLQLTEPQLGSSLGFGKMPGSGGASPSPEEAGINHGLGGNFNLGNMSGDLSIGGASSGGSGANGGNGSGSIEGGYNLGNFADSLSLDDGVSGGGGSGGGSTGTGGGSGGGSSNGGGYNLGNWSEKLTLGGGSSGSGGSGSSAGSGGSGSGSGSSGSGSGGNSTGTGTSPSTTDNSTNSPTTPGGDDSGGENNPPQESESSSSNGGDGKHSEEYPNPDSDTGSGGGPHGPGIASFDPEGSGRDGDSLGFPPGISGPRNPAGMPQPEGGGPAGPASLVGRMAGRLAYPTPDGDGPVGPTSLAGLIGGPM